METQEPCRGEIIDALGCYAGHVFLLEILNNSTEQHTELNFVDLSICSKYSLNYLCYLFLFLSLVSFISRFREVTIGR
jgi:hypothetical protein